MFFFVKQKTEYELRMSDWSSDVCSSDLFKRRFHGPVHDRIAHEEEFDPRPRDEPILPRFVGTVIDPQLETAIVCKVQLMILDRLDGLRRSVVGGECEGCVRRLGIADASGDAIVRAVFDARKPVAVVGIDRKSTR